jgi:hypothetical protein
MPPGRPSLKMGTREIWESKDRLRDADHIISAQAASLKNMNLTPYSPIRSTSLTSVKLETFVRRGPYSTNTEKYNVIINYIYY